MSVDQLLMRQSNVVIALRVSWKRSVQDNHLRGVRKKMERSHACKGNYLKTSEINTASLYKKFCKGHLKYWMSISQFW